MPFSTQSLAASLRSTLPAGFTSKFCVAVSGGLDSAVLLQAMSELREDNAEWKIRAIHVDHQLQAESGEWAMHCRSVADSLNVELTVERVVIDVNDKRGVEAAARAARYGAIRRQLHDEEMLVTAHHADDQAETVLLALLRGSGVPGLAAMPAIKKFGRGWHLRPLLPYTRGELEEWASTRNLRVIDDPSNALMRHDRNYLRHEILPRLKQRWPATVGSFRRSAGHLGEALGLLDDLASSDIQSCSVGRCLEISALRRLTPARCRNVLRYWIHTRQLRTPSTRKLAGLMLDLFNTDLERIPCVVWPGAELHWHRGLLYADPTSEPIASPRQYELPWQWRDDATLPANLGKLSMSATTSAGFSVARLPEKLTIRFRRGGEKIQLQGRQHRTALRNLFQENDVLPWWRDRIPLVYADQRLLAVGDLFTSDEFAAQPGEVAVQVSWEHAPQWKAEQRSDG